MPDAGAHLPQLLDRRRALEVAGHQQRGAAAAAQPQRELARGGGLARALQAAEEDDGGASRQLELAAALAEERDQLVAHHLEHLLIGGQAAEDLGAERLLLHPVDERLHHLEVDVRLEQRHADLAGGGGDVLLADAPLGAEIAEDALETLLQAFEHESLSRSGSGLGCGALLVWTCCAAAAPIVSPGKRVGR